MDSRELPRRPAYELIVLRSPGELRAVAASWDDLWQRSDDSFPTARAETVAQCAEQFAPQGEVRVLAVRRNGRLLAILPLVESRVKRVLSVGMLPGSVWTPGGQLLLDPDCDSSAVLDALVVGIGELAWRLVWLEAAMIDSPRWSGFADALRRAGLAMLEQQRFIVGRCDPLSGLTAYDRARSRNHRRSIKRALQAAEKIGRITFELHAPPSVDRVEPLLRAAFAVENAGWKGAAGSSVLGNAGMFDFFLRQGVRLASWGQLGIALLRLDDRPIAFEYALVGKGTYAPLKVGFDLGFAQLTPGQLLRWHLFRELFADSRWTAVDFVGPICDATARWSTSTYRVCRLVVAPPRLSSRLLLAGYKATQRFRAARSEERRALPIPQRAESRSERISMPG